MEDFLAFRKNLAGLWKKRVEKGLSCGKNQKRTLTAWRSNHPKDASMSRQGCFIRALTAIQPAAEAGSSRGESL
jgi:hypothetical protein